MSKLSLQDNTLLKTQGLVDGQWVGADSGKTFKVLNPFDQSVVAEIADMGAAETRRAIDAAQSAWLQWRNTLPSERKQILIRWAELIEQHIDDLSMILTAEQGKPLAEAHDDIAYGAYTARWNAEEAKRIHGQTVQPPDENRRMMTIRQSLGVVAVITPWNFPSAICMQRSSAALAAGCTVVLKPAEDTPLSALALAELAQRADIPAGVFNVITCQSPEKEVGAELTSNPLVRKISFTGSTDVGRRLMQQSANTVKKCQMELGGNCPLIIFDDADIDAAIDDAIGLKYENAGQICNNINRFLVHEKVHDEFVNKLTAKVNALKLGSGMQEDTQIGPMINEQGVKKVESLIEDAKSKGATVITGGERQQAKQLLFKPTVITNMTPNMRIHQEEIFGPVAAIFRFKTDKQAIDLANDTEYGLAGYFYSQNISRIWQVAEALRCGSVGVNSTRIFDITVPFGGYKQSGIGREGAVVGGLNDFCEIKTICMGSLKNML